MQVEWGVAVEQQMAGVRRRKGKTHPKYLGKM